jgi:hypothetical protein
MKQLFYPRIYIAIVDAIVIFLIVTCTGSSTSKYFYCKVSVQYSTRCALSVYLNVVVCMYCVLFSLLCNVPRN